jgi:dodecin
LTTSAVSALWNLSDRQPLEIAFYFLSYILAKGVEMNSNVYKHIELTGTSQTSIEDAIDSAINQASKTIRNMRWFEVVDIRGTIENENRSTWQVTIKLGFHIEE